MAVLIIGFLLGLFGLFTTIIGETKPLTRLVTNKKGNVVKKLTIWGIIFWCIAGAVFLFGAYSSVDNYITSGKMNDRLITVEKRDTIPQRHLSDADKDSLRKIEPYKQFDVQIITATNSDEQVVYAKEIQKYLQQRGFKNPYLAGQTMMTDVFRIKVSGLKTETNPDNTYTEVEIGSLR